jgi:glycosyltransferase involved in cell wall biosynthesis
MQRMAVVVPAHDEAGAIASVIGSIPPGFVVIAVDDGSTDGTALILEELAGADPRVHPIRTGAHLGYGGAVRAGFRRALELEAEVVVLLDGDGQFDPSDLPRVVGALDGADAVFGYRRRRRDPLGRRVLGRLWNAAATRYLGLRLRDLNCGFKAFRAPALAGLDLSCAGGAISAELAVGLRRRGCRVAELGVSHRPRRAGRASGAAPGVALTALRELRELRR